MTVLVEGLVFGRYRLVELLGRGGMGEVWRADDSLTGRVVALKLLLAQFTGDEDFQRRFRLEAQAAASLNEPHVVPIHGFGEIDGRLFVDMRLIEGRDLKSLVNEGPLAPQEAVSIVAQVASALKAAHHIGLVHRDVKPSNILVTEDGFAYLIDFGIARAVDGTRVTSSGYMMGTWAYMAPERFTSAEVDLRSDVYALACVLYECLTGEWPFPGESLERQFAGHVSMPPPRPSQKQAGLAVFDEVIARGLAKSPGNRYQSATELSQAARAARHTEGKGSGPATAETMAAAQRAAATDWSNPTQLAAQPPQRRRFTRTVFGAVAVTVVLIVVGVITLIAGNPKPDPTATPTHQNPTQPARQTAYGTQVVLPFTELKSPHGIGVDAAGNVYVADTENQRVVELTAGTDTQIGLPFSGLTQPVGLAVSGPGDVYVADFSNPGVVVKLAAGGTSQTALNFESVVFPGSVAVDAEANVYVDGFDVADVVMLSAATGLQTVVPLDEVAVGAIAVDAAGNAYATDLRDQQVIKLSAGWRTQTVLPITDVDPDAIAVDAHGTVYVTDIAHRRVVKLLAGAKTHITLPFTNLMKPMAVAVDAAGNVYVSDFEANQVVMLPAA